MNGLLDIDIKPPIPEAPKNKHYLQQMYVLIELQATTVTSTGFFASCL